MPPPSNPCVVLHRVAVVVLILRNVAPGKCLGVGFVDSGEMMFLNTFTFCQYILIALPIDQATMAVTVTDRVDCN